MSVQCLEELYQEESTRWSRPWMSVPLFSCGPVVIVSRASDMSAGYSGTSLQRLGGKFLTMQPRCARRLSSFFDIRLRLCRPVQQLKTACYWHTIPFHVATEYNGTSQLLNTICITGTDSIKIGSPIVSVSVFGLCTGECHITMVLLTSCSFLDFFFCTVSHNHGASNVLLVFGFFCTVSVT